MSDTTHTIHAEYQEHPLSHSIKKKISLHTPALDNTARICMLLTGLASSYAPNKQCVLKMS